MATQDIADRLVRQLVAKVGQGSHNPVVAPPWVFLGYPYDQTLYLLINPGPALISTSLRSIELVDDQLLIPAPKIVSGLAVAATSSSARRPSR